MSFKLRANFKPQGHQPQAIKQLTAGLNLGSKDLVLLGVTGSGKTFTIAKVIEKVQKPTLVISHNKTLAAQLYQEFRDFFPQNAVSYFVSYYDYYQPEAYLPQTDTYIDKETDINEEIDRLRLAATTNLLTKRHVIVVASVSCIYNLGSPREYGRFILKLTKGMFPVTRESIIKRLVDLQYERDDYTPKRSTFKVIGETIHLWPSYEEAIIHLSVVEGKLVALSKHEPISAKKIQDLDAYVVYPAKHYLTDPRRYQSVFLQIREDLKIREKELIKEGKHLEAYRLRQRVEYDLEMIEEIGYVNGIENYSRYFDGRKPGEPPATLLDYFAATGNDWLCVIDESHMTLPQLRGMVVGDRSRKQTLIDFGFRLPSALDNRPLTFEEFRERVPQTIFMSATPNDEEINLAHIATHEIKKRRNLTLNLNGVIEQLVRPTGLVDPEIEIRPTEGQIEDLVREIVQRKKHGQRVLVTTLTKRLAEELASYLANFKIESQTLKIKTAYLHADIETLERSDILDDLRRGKYDVLVGINLLREGLDLPEVSLVAILDADREGFLRSKTSLIQTMGRAARHIAGKVIMYADQVTNSMEKAIEEVHRRRRIQLKWNKKYAIEPESIKKAIKDKLIKDEEREMKRSKDKEMEELFERDFDQLLPKERRWLTLRLRHEMNEAAASLDFERAAEIREMIKRLSEVG